MSAGKMGRITFMETQKLTSEELDQVTKLAQMFQQTVYEVGMIENTIYNFNKEIDKLNEDKKRLFVDLATLETKEIEVANSLRTKYGEGNINPQTGEISPVS
jgi:tyrosine-protein phosphatase YwqE